MTSLLFFFGKASYDLNNTPYEQAPSFLKSERCFYLRLFCYKLGESYKWILLEKERVSLTPFAENHVLLVGVEEDFQLAPGWGGWYLLFSLEAGQITPIAGQTLLSADLEVAMNAWTALRRALLSMLFIFFTLLWSAVRADVFTAMVDLENLLTSESSNTANIIQHYIESEQRRLNRLKDFATAYEKRNRKNVEFQDLEQVSNPVNAYLLIKRLTSDWKYVQNLMHGNSAENFIKNITQGRLENAVKYPDEDDLDGAAIGLLRLQDTYDLKTADLANGIVAGESVGRGLSAQDCFEIGKAAYNARDYYHTLLWMQEAIDRLPLDRSGPKESDVLEYLAFALYHQGNPKRALSMTKRIVEIDPYHPRAEGNVQWYEERLEAKDKTNLDLLPPMKNERSKKNDILERDEFERLCRGEFEIDPVNASKVYCYYKRDRPFLKLAPIKVEILRYDPLVVLFRNVISDEEIAVVKMLATPRLKRATVQNAQTGELEFASYRISKSAWLKAYDHPIIARINNRIDLMTNLNQETAEDLQVANYGIGGHYDPHYDFSRKEEKNAFKKLGTGNRIATVLFYMSQPDKGGATVYTELKTGVFPSKHDALFWYNLHRSGEGDLLTRHAACPVLTGIKWVSNKWIHERGQEFRRPCGLTPGRNLVVITFIV
ncbi:2OG-Fe(II) oxygenase superfamily domain-containing protein [Ditylenchus destructor]|uniref:procollagen-proline 4-dioxygenase n=1 Tax=Ditylenchus destructor TaxID=166010 RepID=A0AAD4R199_9BILA|nr:2OG-Fe(II) oxygenase superfamily domain-containing protein [Ditylenchus destructor]